MVFKKVMVGLAAASMVIAPTAATAGTRADTAMPAVKASTIQLGERTSASVKKEERIGGSATILAVLAAAAVIAGIIIAVDDDDVSPGT